jgi:hypothetical protein
VAAKPITNSQVQLREAIGWSAIKGLLERCDIHHSLNDARAFQWIASGALDVSPKETARAVSDLLGRAASTAARRHCVLPDCRIMSAPFSLLRDLPIDQNRRIGRM